MRRCAVALACVLVLGVVVVHANLATTAAVAAAAAPPTAVTTPPAAGSPDKWQVLLDWLKGEPVPSSRMLCRADQTVSNVRAANNASFPDVEVINISPEYRELHTRTAIKTDTVIVSVRALPSVSVARCQLC
jgi:hypothetical protein